VHVVTPRIIDFRFRFMRLGNLINPNFEKQNQVN